MRQVRSRRRWALVLLAGASAPLVVASVAYACVSLATITMSPGSGGSGETADGFGKGFRAAHGGATDELASPVEVRWNSREGEVMWTGRPNIDGTLNFSFTVPQSDPGSYMVIAIQKRADGTDASGTPARATFEVTASTEAGSSQFSSSEPITPAAPEAVSPASPAAVPAPSSAPSAAPAPLVTTDDVTPVAPAPASSSPLERPVPLTAVPAPSGGSSPAAGPSAAAPEALVGAPAPEAVAPVMAPDRVPTSSRTALVSSAPESSDVSLALALVGVGLVLSLASSAMVLATRRSRRSLATIR